MILVNDLTVNLANQLSNYYDFIVEDGDCFAVSPKENISSIKADNIKPCKMRINRRIRKWQ